MGTSENYFIKDGYIPNSRNVTLDNISGGTYWDAERIAAAEHFQFDVYTYAARVGAENGAGTVLDIGCGAGCKLKLLRQALPEARLIGVDQPASIEFCRRSYDFGEWYADDFENPGAELGEIRADLIICSDVIEHLLNPDCLLDYIRRRCHPEGRIVLSTPERDLLRGYKNLTPRNKQHIREWNQRELADYLESRGFAIAEHLLQYPVRRCWGRLFYREVVKRAFKFKPLRYNQVLLLRLPGS